MPEPVDDGPGLGDAFKMLGGLGLSMAQSAIIGKDRMPVPLFGQQNPIDFMQSRQMQTSVAAAGWAGAGNFSADITDRLRGLSALKGDPKWTDEDYKNRQAQVEKAKTPMQLGLFVGNMINPDAMQGFGESVTTGLLGGGLAQAYFHQGITADEAGKTARDVVGGIYGTAGKPGEGLRGFGAQHIGSWLQHGLAGGWGPEGRDAKSVQSWAQNTVAPAMAAVRELVPQANTEAERIEAINKSTLGGLNSGMSGAQMDRHMRMMAEFQKSGDVSMGQLAGVGSIAGEYAKQYGGKVSMGREGMLHAGALSAAWKDQGYGKADSDFAGASKDEMRQQDAMLTANARMSRGFNDMAATIRLGEEVGFKKGSQGEAMFEQLKAGKGEYEWHGKKHQVTDGNWSKIMEKSGIDRKLASSTRMEKEANEVYGEQNEVATTVRDQQWNRDLKPWLQGNVRGALSMMGIKGKKGQGAADAALEAMRDFKVNTDDEGDPTKALARRRKEVTEAISKHGIRGKKAELAASRAIGAAERGARKVGFRSMHHVAMMHGSKLTKASQEKFAFADEESARASEVSKLARSLPQRAGETLVDAGVADDPADALKGALSIKRDAAEAAAARAKAGPQHNRAVRPRKDVPGVSPDPLASIGSADAAGMVAQSSPRGERHTAGQNLGGPAGDGMQLASTNQSSLMPIKVQLTGPMTAKFDGDNIVFQPVTMS